MIGCICVRKWGCGCFRRRSRFNFFPRVPPTDQNGLPEIPPLNGGMARSPQFSQDFTERFHAGHIDARAHINETITENITEPQPALF